MLRRFSIGWALAASLFGAPACPAAGEAGGKLDGTSWVLQSFDASGSATGVPAGVTVDARFADSRISGFGGCNSYSGQAVVSGASLAVGALASTQMACSDPANSVETAYLENLRRAAAFTATAERLTIFDGEGKAVLVYRVGKANPLVAAWNVTGIHNGNQAVVGLQTGTTADATFSADGKLSGSGGCNAYTGSYTLAGQSLVIGPLRSTKKACEPAILLQEQQFFTALGKATRIDPSGGSIMLRDDSGAIQVVLSSP
jgi:heat shock protein HslJ